MFLSTDSLFEKRIKLVAIDLQTNFKELLLRGSSIQTVMFCSGASVPSMLTILLRGSFRAEFFIYCAGIYREAGHFFREAFVLSANSTHIAGYPSTTKHYCDIIMGAIASQITSLTIVYSTIHSGADKKHQSSASLVFLRGIQRWPMNSPHKWPVARKMFPFDDVIMDSSNDHHAKYPVEDSRPSHKSYNALDKYPTMHHFVTEICTHVYIFVIKWCIVRYGTGELWDTCNSSILYIYLTYCEHELRYEHGRRTDVLPQTWLAFMKYGRIKHHTDFKDMTRQINSPIWHQVII